MLLSIFTRLSKVVETLVKPRDLVKLATTAREAADKAAETAEQKAEAVDSAETPAKVKAAERAAATASKKAETAEQKAIEAEQKAAESTARFLSSLIHQLIGDLSDSIELLVNRETIEALSTKLASLKNLDRIYDSIGVSWVRAGGFTYESLAAFLGVSKNKARQWVKEQPGIDIQSGVVPFFHTNPEAREAAIEALEETGNYNEAAVILNDRGILTRRGLKWTGHNLRCAAQRYSDWKKSLAGGGLADTLR